MDGKPATTTPIQVNHISQGRFLLPQNTSRHITERRTKEHIDALFVLACSGYLEHSKHPDEPYDANDEEAVHAFWDDAVPNRGVDEFRSRRGRPKKSEHDKKEQIALRVDADVLAWYRSLGSGWQTRMNAVLKAYRDASRT